MIEQILDLADSRVQQELEKKVVKQIELRENCVLVKKAEINGVQYVFDFYNEERKIIGEVYARIGTVKSGQERKVILDCFKLLAAEENLNFKCDKRIVFIDEKVKKHFEGKSWIAKAIEQFKIRLFVEEITEADKEAIKNAQLMQQKGNIKK